MGGWGEVIGGPKVWARDLGLALAVGVTMALLGPFGSYGMPLERRFLICVGYGLAGMAVFAPFVRLALQLGLRAGFPGWFSILAALILGAAPVTATTRLLSMLLIPGGARSDLATLYFGVLAIIGPIGLAFILINRRLAAAQAAPVVATAAEPRLFARLPAHLGREVLALEAEDHYVRVHTARGSTLLLMRFADAVAELDGLEGLRVHRSWWVARVAVAAVRPEGRRLTLTLSNGVAAPVTREAVPLVRRAGWI